MIEIKQRIQIFILIKYDIIFFIYEYVDTNNSYNQNMYSIYNYSLT